jgi:hypothetical protein
MTAVPSETSNNEGQVPLAGAPAASVAPGPAPVVVESIPRGAVVVRRGWVIAGLVGGVVLLLLIGIVLGSGLRGARDRGQDGGWQGPRSGCMAQNGGMSGSNRICGVLPQGANPGGPNIPTGQGGGGFARGGSSNGSSAGGGAAGSGAAGSSPSTTTAPGGGGFGG